MERVRKNVISRITIRPSKKKKNRVRDEIKESGVRISPATSAAVYTAMSRYFPNNYPSPYIANPDLTAPMAPTTSRQRISFATLNDGAGAFQFFILFSMRPAGAYTYSTGYAAGNVSTVGQITNSAYAGLLANYTSLVGVSMEVVARCTAASSAIQGEWAIVNIPQFNPIGANYSLVASYSQASIGVFTDGSPAARGIFMPLDEFDSTLQPVATLPVNNSDTALAFVFRTSAAINFQFDVTFNSVGPLSPAGSQLIPSKPMLVDDGAFSRAFDTISRVIDTNNKIVTNPLYADNQHKGILREMAEYVAGTVKEGALLAASVLSAVRVGGALYYGFGHDAKMHPAHDLLYRALLGVSALPQFDDALPADLRSIVESFRKFKRVEIKRNGDVCLCREEEIKEDPDFSTVSDFMSKYLDSTNMPSIQLSRLNVKHVERLATFVRTSKPVDSKNRDTVIKVFLRLYNDTSIGSN